MRFERVYTSIIPPFQHTGAIEWDLSALDQGRRVWSQFLPMDDGLKKNMVQIVADYRTALN